MKIAFLSTFYPFRGGIAQFNANLYRELEKENEVEAVTFSRQYPDFLFPGETQYVTDQDKNVDEIPSKRWLDTINPLSWAATARKMHRFQPELIVSKYWMTFFGPSLGFVLGKFNKKAIRISILDNVIPHEKRFFDKPANRYFLNRNDGFLVMSDSVLKDLLSLKPDAKYLRLDHPVYDHFGTKVNRKEACVKLGVDPNKKQLLFFGFIRDYKGLDLLLDALSILDDSYELMVAGEVYGSFGKYEKQIEELGISHKVHLFNHYIGDDEVPLYFSAADVCVLPYKSATQSGITSIAMHFELPIIATNVGGLPELVRHDINGLITSPEAKPVAAAIENYFNRNLKKTFAAQLHSEKEKHSWKHFADEVLKFAATLSVAKSR